MTDTRDENNTDPLIPDWVFDLCVLAGLVGLGLTMYALWGDWGLVGYLSGVFIVGGTAGAWARSRSGNG